MTPVRIKPNLYWVGAVDWNVRDFHGYSTPAGSTYNAYLLLDEKTVLFDTVKKPFAKDLVTKISEIVEPERIDYIVVNHVELDHSGALPEIVSLVKPEKIFCSPNGKKALLAHFHIDDWPIEVVQTGSKISLGSRTISFIETRMLHWPDSMFSYIEEDALLISQDAFGQHWATSERFDDEVDESELMYQSAKYYANILLPYSPLVQKLIAQIREAGLRIDMIAPDHGLIWRSNPEKIINAWERWSRQETSEKAVLVYDTMWQSTELMARAIADGLQQAGISYRVMSLSNVHRSDVVTELLDSRSLVLGSSTINNQMLPRVADLLCYLKGLRPGPKIAAAFGSYGWGGEAVKQINAAFEEMKFQVVDEGLRVQYVPTGDDLKKCVDLGRKIGALVRQGAPA
ncbi:MAG: flavodoxin domain-containing protein [Armatimonadota bacterium]|nr:flavodoxin domain-containing protein [Armatimonadota bacterium]